MNSSDLSLSELDSTILKKAETIFDNFKEFSTGYRCMFLIQRHKEGGETNNSKLTKKITRNSDEWILALKELLKIQMSSPLPLRIYSSVNERNFNKAIRKFKYEQLDADYFDQIQKENFYLDIKNRFIGCLMQPQQKATSYFLFDCDNVENTPEHINDIENFYRDIGYNFIKTYPTKNGHHIITKPFNYTKISFPKNTELKKDALLLLSY